MRKLLLLVGLAGCPLLCRAQSTAPSVYVGAKLSVQSGLPFNGYRSTRLGPALTAGVWLSPRVGIELNGAYNWRHDTYHGSYTTNVGVVTEDNDTRLHTLTVPVLLRATLTEPAGRWHFDALAGPTLLLYFTRSSYLQTTQGQTTRSGTDNYVETQVNLTLGPSIRYALAPRLELAVDALVNYHISGFPFSLFAPISSQLSSHALVGIHYRLKP